MAYRIIEKTLVNGTVTYEVQREQFVNGGFGWDRLWNFVNSYRDLEQARKIKQELEGMEVNSIKEVE